MCTEPDNEILPPCLDVLQKRKWENCNTIDKRSWGFRREAVLKDFKNTHQILEQLVSTVRYY